MKCDSRRSVRSLVAYIRHAYAFKISFNCGTFVCFFLWVDLCV
uniref:Isoamylase 1ic n=1 Tax=Rhizophora mucronata TaxID=61149 RepID=A0A2P2KYT1_RHIMU